MKVVIIGASGLIGQAIAQALSAKHEIVQVARSKGDYQVDITSKDTKLMGYSTSVKPRVYEDASVVDTRLFYGRGLINIAMKTFALQYRQFLTGRTLRYYWNWKPLS